MRRESRTTRRYRGGILVLAALLVAGLVVAVPMLASAKDPINYRFTFENGVTIEGTATDNNTFIPNAGGTSVANPTGMTVHVSCSDTFPGGWGEKEGPVQGVDTAWRIESYFIQKGDKTCGNQPPEPPKVPDVDIEKATNGFDADTPTGPEVRVGSTVTWTYVVTNTGDVPLRDLEVVDFELDRTICTRDSLAVGASFTCEATGTAMLGQYANDSKVTAIADIGFDATIISGTSDKGKYYAFLFRDPATGDETFLSGPINDTNQYIPNAGGTSQSNPIGMTMHLSCSDKFTGGWGEKEGPDRVRDSAWQIANFWIFEVKNGELKTKCGSQFPVEQMVMDTDPSHYIGVPGDPGIDIEKATNGQDADEAPGPTVNAGDRITWTYVVTNTGDVDLFDVAVTDDVEGDIGTIAVLRVGETRTLRYRGIAGRAPYENNGCVVGTTEDGDEVDDCDPSHYTPKDPGIDIEKATNGEDADRPTGPQVNVGDTVTWTYVVTNTGDVDLYDVAVRDDQEGLIDTIPFLGVGDSKRLTHTGIAEAGQYENNACARGTTENGVAVQDCDPSHYFGKTPKRPDVDIEKHTNGEDADRPPGPTINKGGAILWEYIVTNTGDVDLVNLDVTDDKEGYVGFISRLRVGETKILTLEGIAVPGQYENLGCVTGSTRDGVEVEDCDPSHYDPPGDYGHQGDIDLEKATNGQDADRATGPRIAVGDPVTWTYRITNTGPSALWGVYLYDEQEGHVACRGRFLAPGQSMTCELESVAVEGQYRNDAWVDAWDEWGNQVSDDDPSHYIGFIDDYYEDPYEQASGAAISLEKAVNGSNADSPTGPTVDTGSTVRLTYTVSNTGDEPLWGVYLFDEGIGHITCPDRYLDPGDSMTCRTTVTAKSGQQGGDAWVDAWGYADRVTDENPGFYFGVIN